MTIRSATRSHITSRRSDADSGGENWFLDEGARLCTLCHEARSYTDVRVGDRELASPSYLVDEILVALPIRIEPRCVVVAPSQSSPVAIKALVGLVDKRTVTSTSTSS